MNINGNPVQRAWQFLKNRGRHQPATGDGAPVELPPVEVEPRLSPLERIQAYLCQAGLSGKVQVRFEAADGDFILEDSDGCVHAKDYPEAVQVIQRIWLYLR